MCGRFTLSTPRTELIDAFPLFDIPEMDAHYNIAPTQEVPVARFSAEENKPTIAFCQWGLVPSWADDPKLGARMINARSETVATKPSFRSAFRKRRCLILSDGFYEWKKLDGKHKQPYFFHLQDRKPFVYAGLWEHWERDGNIIESCTILTTEANDLLRPLHERMPVILDAKDYGHWLDPENLKGTGLQELLTPYPSSQMVGYPVAKLVNNFRNDVPECIEPLEEMPSLFP